MSSGRRLCGACSSGNALLVLTPVGTYSTARVPTIARMVANGNSKPQTLDGLKERSLAVPVAPRI